MRPIRIILAYDGLRTERGARAALVTYLERHLPEPNKGPVQGFGPPDLPSLVICHELALIKLNGMPFAARSEEPYKWPCFSSAHGKSGILLLEVLWTRLASFHPGAAADLFGDDRTLESTMPLLIARVAEQTIDGEQRYGWVYEVVEPTQATLDAGLRDVMWEPAPITPELNATILLLARHGGLLDLHNPTFRDSLSASKIDYDSHVAELTATGLLWVQDGRWLRSLADRIVTVFLPDGRMAVADESDPRLVRWASEQRMQSDPSC